MKTNKGLFTLLILTAAVMSAQTMRAQTTERPAGLSAHDLKAPMGWATCTSLTSGDDYQLTGGASGNSITLTASGGDDCSAIENAIKNYPVIVFDGSAGDYETNIAATREIVKIAHSFGASVEGEIGHVGLASEGFEDLTDMYTTPEEAKAYIDATGVDALAIAIGSAHGVYKKKPMLNIERLKEIRAAVDTPLVLHGGSGLSDDDFKNTIREGIAKVNIFTDLCLAGDRATTDGNAQGIGYLATRNLKVEYIKEAVKEKIRLFGSENKA